MEEMKAALQGIKEELEIETVKSKIETLNRKKGCIEYGLERGIPYCLHCYKYVYDWQKHENTNTHYKKKWKDK
jgi:hypothetical protein